MAGESRKRKVGLLYDERMCKHDTPDGEDHPECPNRIKAIWAKLQLTGLAQRCAVLGGSKAEDKHLQLVHTKEHVNLVKRLSTKKKDSRRNKIASKLDSVYLNGGSSEAAYLAAGSVVEGTMLRQMKPWGFCLFNNVAVAAIYLLNQRKMFWKDPRVLVFSVHRHDDGSFYPTGDDGDYDKVGEGGGEQGRRCGDEDYIAVIFEVLHEYVILRAVCLFNLFKLPPLKTAVGDPRGGCFVTPNGYSVRLKKLMEFAIVMALEGGYNLGSVAKSSLACVQVRKRLCAYWPSLADELPWEAKTPSPKEASDKLRLRISRDRYAAEVKEAAEQLAKVRSKLREVQIDLNLHRELLKKATESNQGGAAGHGIREHEEFIHSRLWETHEVMMTYKTDLNTPVAIEHITKD
ncbi:hypothetical protein F2Q68_00012447 [Brassica cretica]|uniref:Histone deacetylase domain-containing protein n=1 Tax=Brassica cretica TaxID=69181 RepID=A0A8S9KRT8_BRACR|nr:hypothetical protein F2Q68_00012447 [Brassica cretica]